MRWIADTQTLERKGVARRGRTLRLVCVGGVVLFVIGLVGWPERGYADWVRMDAPGLASSTVPTSVEELLRRAARVAQSPPLAEPGWRDPFSGVEYGYFSYAHPTGAYVQVTWMLFDDETLARQHEQSLVAAHGAAPTWIAWRRAGRYLVEVYSYDDFLLPSDRAMNELLAP